MNEHEFEPVRGLPENLPGDEKIVWQGEPNWVGLSASVFHVRKVAIYFAVVMAISLALTYSDDRGLAGMLGSAGWLSLLAVCSALILSLLGWLYSRTTVYTITNQRLVMRFGVAIPMMINIPWSKIQGARLRTYKDGSGDIVLTLMDGHRVSYWMLWPHARPWRFSPVEPMLRNIPDASAVAAQLGSLLADAFGDEAVANGRGSSVAPPRRFVDRNRIATAS